jgi:DNA-binding transcriptional regulator YiaG
MATRQSSSRTERRPSSNTTVKAPPKRRVDKTRKPRTAQEIVADLEARIAELRSRVAARKAKEKRATEPRIKGPRFSPKWLASHREKIAVSAADYAALVGVSALTVYNWEKGKTKPRAKQLESLAKVRTLKKREAWKQLDAMGV